MPETVSTFDYELERETRKEIGGNITSSIEETAGIILNRQDLANEQYAEYLKRGEVYPDSDSLDWSKFIAFIIDLPSPVTLGEVKAKYPFLFEQLTRLINPEEQLRRDRELTEEDKIFAIGFWRNPPTDYSALKFHISGNDGTYRNISLEGGFYAARTWEESVTKTDISNRYKTDIRDMLDIYDGTEAAKRFLKDIL